MREEELEFWRTKWSSPCFNLKPLSTGAVVLCDLGGRPLGLAHNWDELTFLLKHWKEMPSWQQPGYNELFPIAMREHRRAREQQRMPRLYNKRGKLLDAKKPEDLLGL